MSLKMTYSFACICGKKRKNNEDNFYINGMYGEKNHPDTGILTDVISVDDPGTESVSFGVFDGMGGEKDGEVASYMAARSFASLDELTGRYGSYKPDTNREDSVYEEKIIRHLRNVNDEILNYCKEKHYRAVGTTVAGVTFKEGRCYMYNLGDSRVYRIRRGEMQQVSVDHSIRSFLCPGGALTQFLGIDTKEFIIDPNIVSDTVQPGDGYLLCSDGVTNMVDEDHLKDIILKSHGTSETVEEIIRQVNENGAKDNATAVFICIETTH